MDGLGYAVKVERNIRRGVVGYQWRDLCGLCAGKGDAVHNACIGARVR